MLDLNSSDPATTWLVVTNVVLGAVVVICCAAVAFGVVQELVERARSRKELDGLDREVQDLVSSYQLVHPDAREFRVPELGTTMADGGERIPPEQGKR